MGTAIVARDANFEPTATRIIPPVNDGLRVWGYPHDTLAKVGRNYADGSKMVVVGNPVVSASFSRLTGQNAYIDTGITDAGAFTVLFAMKLPNALTDGPVVVGNAGSSSQPYTLIYFADINTIRLDVTRQDGAGGQVVGRSSLAAQDFTGWNLFAAYCGNDGVVSQQIQNLTTGQNGGVSTGVTPRVVAPGTLLVGSDRNAGRIGNVDVAHFQFFDRVLSQAEIERAAAPVRRYLSEVKGITV